jgi:hypothetical protein
MQVLVKTPIVFAILVISVGSYAQQSVANLNPAHATALEKYIRQREKGDYRVAFEKKVAAPLVCFLHQTIEKRKKLYFAVYETDEHFIMAPAGTGYLVKYEPQ